MAPRATARLADAGPAPAARALAPADAGPPPRTGVFVAGLVVAAIAVTLAIAGVMGIGSPQGTPSWAVASQNGDGGTIDEGSYEEGADDTIEPAAPDEADEAAVADPATEYDDPIMLPMTTVFVSDDPDDPADVCFGPGPRPKGTSWMRIDGERVESAIVQCGSSQSPDDADGTMRFDLSSMGLPEGTRVIGMDGRFLFDESATSQQGSTAEWTVDVDGTTLCTVTAEWGESGTCSDPATIDVGSTSVVTITQRVRPALQDMGVWAGVYEPYLTVQTPVAAAYEPPSGLWASTAVASGQLSFEPQDDNTERASEVIAANSCQSCHVIGSGGGSLGPDLNTIGAQNKGVQWHIDHLKAPSSKVPGSAMPPFDSLAEPDLRALAIVLDGLGTRYQVT